MDRKVFDNIIKESVKETLEEMAFIEVIPSDGLQKKCTETIKAMLQINTPKELIFIMECDKRLLDEITANIFANSNCQGDELRYDVLAEVLNTSAGRIMKLITPNNEYYDLGIPLFNVHLERKYKNNLQYKFLTFDHLSLTFEVLFN